jgi:hypothetical protein
VKHISFYLKMLGVVASSKRLSVAKIFVAVEMLG